MQLENKNNAFNNLLIRELDKERPHDFTKVARMHALLRLQKEPPLRNRAKYFWENEIREVEL